MQAAEDRKPIDVAETDAQKIERLEKQVATERYHREFYEKIADERDLYEVFGALSKAELKVLNQRDQLKNMSASAWRRKQAARKMRQTIFDLTTRLKQVDPEWYDDYSGKTEHSSDEIGI